MKDPSDVDFVAPVISFGCYKECPNECEMTKNKLRYYYNENDTYIKDDGTTYLKCLPSKTIWLPSN